MNRGGGPPIAFGVFMATWIVLAVICLVGYLVLSPAAKRRWYPRMTILAGTLFPIFVFAISASDLGWRRGLAVLAFVVPASAAITYANLKANRICLHCGRLVQSWGRLWPVHFCPKCGRPLDSKPAPAADDVLD